MYIVPRFELLYALCQFLRLSIDLFCRQWLFYALKEIIHITPKLLSAPNYYTQYTNHGKIPFSKYIRKSLIYYPRNYLSNRGLYSLSFPFLNFLWCGLICIKAISWWCDREHLVLLQWTLSAHANRPETTHKQY